MMMMNQKILMKNERKNGKKERKEKKETWEVSESLRLHDVIEAKETVDGVKCDVTCMHSSLFWCFPDYISN